MPATNGPLMINAIAAPNKNATAGLLK